MISKMFSPHLKDELVLVETFLENQVSTSDYLLKESFMKVLKSGGKRIRPAFVFLSGELLGKSYRDLLRFASALELVHMSTLIHDDIIDEADLRRGKPTLNKVRGDEWALFAGNYLFSEALDIIEPSENPEIAKMMSKIARLMVEGEFLQYLSMYDTEQSVINYFRRIRGKTALLLALSCETGAMVAKKDAETVKSLYNFGYNLGMAFQIIDDILDLSFDLEINKTQGKDLLQGIINLPVLLVLKEETPEAVIVKRIIDGRFKNGKRDLEQIMEILKKANAIDRARETALKYTLKARSYLEKLPDNRIRKELEDMTQALYERKI